MLGDKRGVASSTPAAPTVSFPSGPSHRGTHVDERIDEVAELLSQIASAMRRCLAALPEIERAVTYGQYY